VRRSALLGGLLSVVCLSTLGSVCRAAPSQGFLLNSAVQLLGIKPETRSVTALWDLDAIKGLGELFPTRSVGGTYLGGVAFASDLEDVYLVVPTEIPDEADGPTHFAVVRIRLPRWDSVQAEYRISTALNEAPAIAFRDDSHELYMEYQDPKATAASSGGLVREIRVLDRFDLHKIRSLHSESPPRAYLLPRGQAYPFFTADTFFVPGTDIAYNRGNIIHFTEGRYSAKPFDFGGSLTADVASRLEHAFVSDQLDDTSNVGLQAVDGEGRWALARGIGTRRSGAGESYVVVDLTTSLSVGMVDAPPSVARLLPDGRVLVQELVPTPGGAVVSRSVVRTTGRVWIYDPVTGSRTAAFSGDQLKGSLDEVYFVCATPSADVLFFRGVNGGHSVLLSVDAKSEGLEVVESDFIPDRLTKCIFVDSTTVVKKGAR
jgi:hypothetical protein